MGGDTGKGEMARELPEIVGRIYAGAGRANGWPHTLAAVAGTTGAASGCIVAVGPEDARGSVGCFHNIDPAWIEVYNDYYHRFDPTPELLEDGSGVPVRDHVRRACDAGHGDRASVFYNEVMIPQDFRHTLAVGFSTHASWKAALVLQRTRSQGPFGPEAGERIGALADHLRRALDLHARLQHSRLLGGEDLQGAFHDAPTGIVVLDGRARPLFVNARARELLAATDALAIGDGTLHVAATGQQRALDRLVGRALHAGRGEPAGDTRRLTLHDRDGAAALNVHVSPLQQAGDGDPLAALNGAALLWITPAGCSVERAARAVERAHALTRAEAESLAWILRGCSIDQVAEQRGVSAQTARTQLKSLMSKTGVHRQAELVRLALTTVDG